jgi:peptidoglycan/LPS O-acetylase OafA/YrhL
MRDSPNLDLLRAIAVSFVVASHLFYAVTGAEVQLLGGVGVAIFFVHTSLVLMLSLQRQGASAAAFYIRRFFRIYPLAVFVVLLVAAWNWLASTPTAALMANLLLIQNITGDPSVLGPLWSLPYEVQMYLVLPLLFVWARKVRQVVVLLVFAVGLVLTLAAVGWAGAAQVPKFVPSFLPGVLAFLLASTSRRRLPPAVLFGVVGVAGAVGFWMAMAPEFGKVLWMWAASAAVGLSIPYCRELSWPAIQRAAKMVATYSYSIYLMHQIAINIAFRASLPLSAQLALFAALLVSLTWLTYRWIEAPGIALGARLAARYSARISAPRPAAISPPASRA